MATSIRQRRRGAQRPAAGLARFSKTPDPPLPVRNPARPPTRCADSSQKSNQPPLQRKQDEARNDAANDCSRCRERIRHERIGLWQKQVGKDPVEQIDVVAGRRYRQDE